MLRYTAQSTFSFLFLTVYFCWALMILVLLLLYPVCIFSWMRGRAKFPPATWDNKVKLEPWVKLSVKMCKYYEWVKVCEFKEMFVWCIDFFYLNYPSIVCNRVSFSGSLGLIPADIEQDAGYTSWISCQFITGLTYWDKAFTLTLVTNLPNFWMHGIVGGSQSAWREPVCVSVCSQYTISTHLLVVEQQR